MEIKRIAGIPKNKPIRDKRNKETTREKVSKAKPTELDEVSLSHAARRASEVKRYVQIAKDSNQIRNSRIKRAEADIKRGTHDKPEVVRKTAKRVLRDL